MQILWSLKHFSKICTLIVRFISQWKQNSIFTLGNTITTQKLLSDMSTKSGQLSCDELQYFRKYFLYARLQTGRIMVWWCPSGSPSGSPSVRPSIRPSVRPTLRPSGLRPPIFRTFLLHALTYWAEILHMTLFWCTTDQVRLSSLCVNFWRSYASLWT